MKRKVTRLVVLLIFMLFLFPLNSFAEKTVVIDPGHGGEFTSTCGYSGDRTGFCEKDANLLVALKLRDLLKNTDIKVHLTRSTDKAFASYLRGSGGDFEKRMSIANDFARGNNENSIFISIHHNQDPTNPLTRGLETYYYDGINHYNEQYPPDPMQLEFLQDSKRLAEDVHPKLIDTLGLNDRELRNDQSFYVLRNAQMPAILVELGFMTNPTEEQLIKSNTFQQKAAQVLADSLIKYFKVFEVFDSNHNKLKTFSEKDAAISYAEGLNFAAIVFDKDKQKMIFPNQQMYEVYDQKNHPLANFLAFLDAINNPKLLVGIPISSWNPNGFPEEVKRENTFLASSELSVDGADRRSSERLTADDEVDAVDDRPSPPTAKLTKNNKILRLDSDKIVTLGGPFWWIYGYLTQLEWCETLL